MSIFKTQLSNCIEAYRYDVMKTLDRLQDLALNNTDENTLDLYNIENGGIEEWENKWDIICDSSYLAEALNTYYEYSMYIGEKFCPKSIVEQYDVIKLYSVISEYLIPDMSKIVVGYITDAKVI